MAPETHGALRWTWLSLAVVVLDQLAKYAAEHWLSGQPPVTVIPGFLDLVLVHNTGAAFSLFSQAAGWQRWFFSVLALVISGLIVLWLRRTPGRDWTTALPLALVLGGAVGNLIDRLYLGYVIDFIDVYVGSWHWPAFNVADSAITVGALAYLLSGLRPKRPQ